MPPRARVQNMAFDSIRTPQIPRGTDSWCPPLQKNARMGQPPTTDLHSQLESSKTHGDVERGVPPAIGVTGFLSQGPIASAPGHHLITCERDDSRRLRLKVKWPRGIDLVEDRVTA